MLDRVEILSLLAQIESEMQRQALWESTVPPAEAFDSQLPFCVDTLRFNQWLQWVFVARFRALLEGRHPLPASCEISTMAEEAFKGMETDVSGLLALLRQFDELFK